jgi:hypothetical protein
MWLRNVTCRRYGIGAGGEEGIQGGEVEGGGETEAAEAANATEANEDALETATEAEYSVDLLLEYLERATTRIQIQAKSAAAGMAAALGLAL